MKNYVLLVSLSFSIVLARTSSASIFGEENAPLMAIFSESVKQTLELKETLMSVRETTVAAREAAHAAQQAVEATPRIKALLEDPQAFFSNAEKAWSDTFPSIEALHQQTSKTSHRVKKTTGLDLHYDQASGKVIQFGAGLAHDAGNLFESWAREVDSWGISETHDEMMSILGEHHRMALENLADLATSLDLHLLTPMEATIHSARATAIEAIAVVESAGALGSLARNEKIKLLREVQEAASREVEHAQNIARGVASAARQWQMRPIFSRPMQSSNLPSSEEGKP